MSRLSGGDLRVHACGGKVGPASASSWALHGTPPGIPGGVQSAIDPENAPSDHISRGGYLGRFPAPNCIVLYLPNRANKNGAILNIPPTTDRSLRKGSFRRRLFFWHPRGTIGIANALVSLCFDPSYYGSYIFIGILIILFADISVVE